MVFKQLILFALIAVFSSKLQAQNVLGIDVSKWQGTINWELVAEDGYVFSWVKATEGMTYTDPKFYTNIEGGISEDLIMGAYHFARPDNNTAQQDATNFLNVASAYIGTGFLPPVLDLENPYVNGQAVLLTELFTSEELSLWAQEWMEAIHNATGVAPFLYVNGNYANHLSPDLNSYGLWFAQPDETLNPPSNTGNWDTWGFKQYSWWGDISGISGDVDLNIFNGSIADLDTLIGLTTTSMISTLDFTVSAFPNPTKNSIYLNTHSGIQNAIMFDLKGVNQMLPYSNQKIDCSRLKPGIYYLKITSNQGQVVTHKIFKL
jgi:GH25 family lysozyme M1 (1,4-beta-N-acetylmuramidase)